MKKIIFLVGIFLFLSCKQNKFYLEIKRLNDGIKLKRNSTFINLRNHDNYIKNLNELVYYKSSYRDIQNGKLKSFHLIYNVKNKKVFLTWFENKKEVLEKNEAQFDSISMKDIVYFINKDFDKIKRDALTLEENSSLPQLWSEYYYVNLDSINKSYKFIID